MGKQFKPKPIGDIAKKLGEYVELVNSSDDAEIRKSAVLAIFNTFATPSFQDAETQAKILPVLEDTLQRYSIDGFIVKNLQAIIEQTILEILKDDDERLLTLQIVKNPTDRKPECSSKPLTREQLLADLYPQYVERPRTYKNLSFQLWAEKVKKLNISLQEARRARDDYRTSMELKNQI